MAYFVGFPAKFLYSWTLPTSLVWFNLCILVSLFLHFRLTSCLEWELWGQSAFWGHLGLAPLILALSANRFDYSRLTSKCDKCFLWEHAVYLNGVISSLYAFLWGMYKVTWSCEKNQAIYNILTKFLFFSSILGVALLS